MNNVTSGLTVRFSAAKQIYDTFSLLGTTRRCQNRNGSTMQLKLQKSIKKVNSEDLNQEMNYISIVRNVNFGTKQLSLFELMSALAE